MESSQIQIDNTNQILVDGFVGFVPGNLAVRSPPSPDQESYSGDSVSDSETETETQAGSDSDEDSVLSDCESTSSGATSGPTTSGPTPVPSNALLQLVEGDRLHDQLKQRFLASLGLLGNQSSVVSIQRNVYSGLMAQARVQSFKIFAKAMEKKCGGAANVKFAWFGGTKEDLCNVMKHGFGPDMIETNNCSFGRGIYLSPDNCPAECVKKLAVDEDGLRHILLCRVILGKAELIRPGSEQSHPSSEEFDSGVDDLQCPRKYIVWSSNMNSHVLPEYMISVRAPSCLQGFYNPRDSSKIIPTSPWMPFPLLIAALSKFLPAATVRTIANYHKDLKEKKITRQDLIRQMRHLAGDKLLITIIRSYRMKQVNASGSFQQTMIPSGGANGLSSTGKRGSFH